MDDCCEGENSQNVPSDIDSQVCLRLSFIIFFFFIIVINLFHFQMSLPRSYTLPREFKFNRRYEGRKAIKNEHFVASTNSSDGELVVVSLLRAGT